MEKDIICWWSGGITSAVACRIAIDIYGMNRCRLIFLDTKNEHEDTYRFMDDCSRWYKLPIESLSGIPDKYDNIQDVWTTHKQLNTANGAVCSYKLKRVVRETWEKNSEWSHQIFGFEFEKKELNRAKSLKMNHPHTRPLFPLLMAGLDKEDCIKIVQDQGIKIPEAYSLGFQNNNCLRTGCISGGIGYWQKIAREYPDKFDAMAKMEHKLTHMRGYPVTMLKDQSKEAKQKVKDTGDKRANLVFLKFHVDYPDHKTLADMEGREPKPLTDCNGFCGVEDLSPQNKTELELFWDGEF